MTTQISVNIGSGNGVLSVGIKPLFKPMLAAYIQLGCTESDFAENAQEFERQHKLEIYTYKLIAISSLSVPAHQYIYNSIACRNISNKSAQNYLGSNSPPTANMWLKITPTHMNFLCFNPRPVLAFGYCCCMHLSVCVSVCVRQPPACPRDNSSPVRARITKSLNLDHRCRGPFLRSLLFCFGGWLTMTFKAKLNFKVKMYPILSFSVRQLITCSS